MPLAGGLACGRGALRDGAGRGVQPLRHADRAARLHSGALRCSRALQQHPHRLRQASVALSNVERGNVGTREQTRTHCGARAHPVVYETTKTLRPSARSDTVYTLRLGGTNGLTEPN